MQIQALRYMPLWDIQSGRYGGINSVSYKLDYMQMLPFVVLIESLRRGHLLVFITTLSELIIKVHVVLSASIFQLATVSVPESIDVRLLSSFDPSNNMSTGARASSTASVWALQTFDMQLLFGLAADYAYQTFTINGDDDSSQQQEQQRPTIGGPVTATVEGLFMDAECVGVESYSFLRMPVDDDANVPDFGTFSVKFDNCDATYKFSAIGAGEDTEKGTEFWTFSDLDQYSDYGPRCSSAGLPGNNTQLFYYGARFSRSDISRNASDLRPVDFAAVLCTSYAWVADVVVRDDGVSPELSPSPRSSGRPFDVDPWERLGMGSQSLMPFTSTGSSGVPPRGPVNVFSEIFRGEPDLDEDELYHDDILRRGVRRVFKTFGASVSHYQLRSQQDAKATATVSGTRERRAEKLQLNLGWSLSAIVLLVFCAGLALSAFYLLLGMTFNFPVRDPMTAIGSMLFLQRTSSISGVGVGDQNRGGAAPREMSKRAMLWSHCTFTPLALKPWVRCLVIGFAMTITISLAVTVNASNTQEGLATVSKEGYSSFVWQSFPTLMLFLVSLYTSSTDITIRGLHTLSELSGRPCSAGELDRSLLDMIGLRALYHSVRRNARMVIMSQSLALMCGFLPILGSVLFRPEPFPSTTDMTVQQQSWFGHRVLDVQNGEAEIFTNRFSVGSLSLMRNISNITYPDNTYDDLLFPTIDIGSSNAGEGRTARFTAQAAKLSQTCERLEPDRFDIKVENGTRLSKGQFVNITDILTCPDGRETLKLTTKFALDFTLGSLEESLENLEQPQEAKYFSREIVSPNNTDVKALFCMDEDDDDDAAEESDGESQMETEFNSPWREQTYIWGRFNASSWDFEHLAIWRCNYSWTQVSTEVSLVSSGAKFIIDRASPPVEDPDSARPYDPPFSIPVFEDGQLSDKAVPSPFLEIDVQVAEGAGIDARFGNVVRPFGPLAVEDLGDPDAEDKVLGGLHSSLRLVAAQLANLEHRLALDETSDAEPRRHGPLEPIRVQVTDNHRSRLVQNEGVTVAVIVVLALTVLVNVWALLSSLLRQRSSPPHNEKPSSRHHSWMLDMELRGLAPASYGSVAMMEALLHGSNAPWIMGEDAPLLPKGELHRRLNGSQFRLGWFYNRETQAEEYTVGVLGDDSFEFLRDKEVVCTGQEKESRQQEEASLGRGLSMTFEGFKKRAFTGLRD